MIRKTPITGMTGTLSVASRQLAQRNPRTRKCAVKGCQNKFVPRSITHKACSPECAALLADRIRIKREKKSDSLRREAIKTRSQWIKEAQEAFNVFIRMRDRLAGYSCISSGRDLDWRGNGVDAGHYRSIGSAPHLRFDERNCHAQSKKDNQYLSGNAVDYRIGLIKRIGIDAVESIESDQTPRKYTIEQLKQIKAEYKLKLKLLIAVIRRLEITALQK